jgi:hypothetical protein
MKCDKLKAEPMIINDDYMALYYPKDSVDAAIAELKAKLEDVQATAYADSVDAGMENRRMKRALWLARAERALSEQYVISNAVLYLENKFNHKFNSVRHELHVWGVVKRKCRSKAKEYK